jgi:Holliday junction resolvase
MSNRTRGDYFERKTAGYLRMRGWLVVRAAGSIGAFDLVAIPEGYGAPWLIQCKIGARLDPGEWNRLLELGTRHLCVPVLAYRTQSHALVFRQIVLPKQKARERAGPLTQILHPETWDPSSDREA